MRPDNMLGLAHLALKVKNLEECVIFYRDLLGMTIDWQPDRDNIYLTTGNDNLALHRASQASHKNSADQTLDHFGFALKTFQDVDLWFNFLVQNKVMIKTPPKTHRDGTRSFYCRDPDGNNIQIICLKKTPAVF